MDYNGMPNDGPQPTRRQKPIDLDFRKYAKQAKRLITVLVIVIALAVVAFNAVYQLPSGCEAVVTSFGRYARTEEIPGLKLKVPFAERTYVIDIEGVRRLEFGYRTIGGYATDSSAVNMPSNYSINNTGNSQGSYGSEYVDNLGESSMLTKDENIVIADWAIQYKVADSRAWLFNVMHPVDTLRIISESTYRRVVASHNLDDILTDQKETMQNEVLVDLQAICNEYGLGVIITSVELQDAMPPDAVRAAFLDVTAAQEEKAAMINEATRYANERLPIARGDAEKALNDAEGYKQERINEAIGATARYVAIEAEYAKMPQITKTRMHLEMMRAVLPNIKHVYIMDETSGETLKVLSLDTEAPVSPAASAHAVTEGN